MSNNSSFARALVLIIIGCLLIGLGFSLGGRWIKPNRIQNLFLSLKEIERPWFIDDSLINQNDLTWIDSRLEPFTDELSALDLDISYAHIIVRSGNEPGYRIQGFSDSDLIISLKENTLSIRDVRKLSWTITNNQPNRRAIEIILPKGIIFSSIKINLGAGFCSLSSLEANGIYYESGAGVLEANYIQSAVSRFEGGVGKIEISNSSLRNTHIETGAGLIDFSGNLRGNSTIESGVGAIQLHLDEGNDSYFIRYEKGIGSIHIDQKKLFDPQQGTIGNQNAENKIKINTGVGNINLVMPKL